ncbi:hypothetical protein C0J52_26176, partial [Blattella germanica]
LLRERIHQTQKDLAATDLTLYHLHLKLSNILTVEDWNKIDVLTHQSAQNTFIQVSDRQKRKFERLQKSSPTPKLDTSRIVVNLSKRILTTAETSLLEKGGNYAVTPEKIPIEDIIANLESAIGYIPTNAAEEIRNETTRILHKAKRPQRNLSKEELQAIRTLNADDSILILGADKGNATVVMAAEEYKTKI